MKEVTFVLHNYSKGLWGKGSTIEEVKREADWIDGNEGRFKTVWCKPEQVTVDGLIVNHPEVAVQTVHGCLDLENLG